MRQSALSRSEIGLLFLLAMVQFTHIMDFMIMMPLGPQLMRIFAISPKQFGFLVSAYTFAAGFSGFIGAIILDRFDRKKALLFCYVGFALGTFACAVAPTYNILLLARALAGAFGGVLGAIALAIVGDSIAFEKRGRAMGLIMTSFSLASVFGVPFGIYLANMISWHAPFVAVGLIAVFNINLIFLFMTPKRGHLHAGIKRVRVGEIVSDLGSDPNQLTALTVMSFLTLSQFLLIPFFSPSMVANVGFKETELPYIYFVGGALTIFTSPFVGRLADRFGKLKVFYFAATLLFIPVLTVTQLGPSPIFVALIFTSMFFIFSNSRFIPAMALITSTVKPETRGRFMSINSCVQSLSSGVAALIGGQIIEKSLSGRLLHFEVLGYVSMVMSLIAMVLIRKIKPVA